MKDYWKILIFIGIAFLLIYGYFLEENKSNVVTNPTFSKQEQLEMEIEELKEENFKLEEERDDLTSQLDELQRQYEYDEDLIAILRGQLESYGIEPYEL